MQAYVAQMNINTMVSVGGDYYDSVCAHLGDEISVQIRIDSTGMIPVNESVLRLELPEEIEIVKGSVLFTANNSGVYDAFSDSIVNQGINFSKIGSGNRLEITCKLCVKEMNSFNEYLEILTYYSYKDGDCVRSNIIRIQQ